MQSDEGLSCRLHPGPPLLRCSQVKSQDKALGLFVTFACWEKEAVRALLQPVDSLNGQVASLHKGPAQASGCDH